MKLKKYSFGHFVLDVFLTVITGGLWLCLIVGYWIVKIVRKAIENKLNGNSTNDIINV